MKHICKLSLDGNEGPCTSRSVQQIEFGINRILSFKDRQEKKLMKNNLINSASKCIEEGECEGLDLILLSWDKCEVCKKEIPNLVRNIINPLKSSGVPVDYKILDAKQEGLSYFIQGGCKGTPCVLVKNNSTGEYVKGYDGSQKEIGALSSILNIPNPFFRDLSGKKPLNMLKKEYIDVL